MKQTFSWVAVFLASLPLFSAPTQAGQAYFQIINVDADGDQDEAYYPRVAAPDKVSATSNFAGSTSVYRLHSWAGGAALWATGQQESSHNGYFVALSGQITASGNNQTWPSPLFQQGPVLADPVIFSYSNPPNLSGSNANARGIFISQPYPYLAPDTAYGASCQSSDSTWATAPLAIFTDPIPMILLYPSSSAPTDGVASADSIWQPTALLVDKMGDYSIDLIYQNPSNAYLPGGYGNYIKCTIVQGSPYIFVECLGAPYVVISNRITTSSSSAIAGLIQSATAPAAIPTLSSNFQYSILAGNQIDPGQFAANTTLNPLVSPQVSSQGQSNYTTWGVYFNSNTASFTPGTATTQPQNSYLTITDPTTRCYFVIAAAPTVFLYPYDGASTYASATTAAGYVVNNYITELGKYAFNFITNTAVTYAVTQNTFVNTTFTPTLTQPYGATSVADTTKTVMCLMPHHYQDQTFDTGLAPTVLPASANWSNFTPTSTASLFYWTVRGNLRAILGSNFTTQYIFSNFLPVMPPPFWTDTVTLGISGSPTVSIGQLLFDSLDNEFVNNLANSAYAPWNTSYFTLDKGIYDVGKTLAKGGKQLGLLLHFLQGCEENCAPGQTFSTFFGNGTGPTSTNCPGGCSFYTNGYTSLYEQQYNNDYSAQPSRPGAFNPCAGLSPTKTLSQAFHDSLKVSVEGSASPVLSGMQGAINGYFGNNPVASSGGYQLSHFAFYDPLAHLVMLYPSAGDPSTTLAWPGRAQSIPNHAGLGSVWESFGVADAFNDHHYQYGWWLVGAGLTALYDGAWSSTPTAGSWASSTQYGSAIDQLVKDIAYDPAIDSHFYSDDSQTMTFAKMNFFDQWAGHGWADGIQATIAGGNSGHNENSIGEALQAYASIILWGMATQRRAIVDLGIYLYTTCCYAMDSYFFDKNLNFKPGGSFFTPTITSATPPSGYTLGNGFWNYTIHSATTSGTPKMTQGVLNYSADFGQTPLNVRTINAFPCNSMSLVFGRNRSYLQAWNAAMDTSAFFNTVSSSNTSCWVTAFVSNINMLRALGGNTTSLGIPSQPLPSTLTPYQGIVQVFTSQVANGCPPWGSTGGSYADPGQSINEVLHFLHIIDHYGTPDWKYYAYVPSAPSTLLSSAAFTKSGTTIGFAFNPTLSSISVQFYKISDNTTIGSPLTVQPKRWGQVQLAP